MKFCKDCKHYSPAGCIASIFASAAWPATCNYGDKRDPVTGNRRITGLCDAVRSDESKCGSDGAWFAPVTLQVVRPGAIIGDESK